MLSSDCYLHASYYNGSFVLEDVALSHLSSTKQPPPIHPRVESSSYHPFTHHRTQDQRNQSCPWWAQQRPILALPNPTSKETVCVRRAITANNAKTTHTLQLPEPYGNERRCDYRAVDGPLFAPTPHKPLQPAHHVASYSTVNPVSTRPNPAPNKSVVRIV